MIFPDVPRVGAVLAACFNGLFYVFLEKSQHIRMEMNAVRCCHAVFGIGLIDA
jgi:ABC-type Mn2+/Zn2+ transport system permease subunit